MPATELMSCLSNVFASVENETYRVHSMSESPPAPPNSPPAFNGSSFCMLTPLDASIDLHPSGNGYILTHNQIKFQIQVIPPENEQENIIFNCVSNPAFMKNINEEVTSLCFASDANAMATPPIMPPMLFPVPIFQTNGHSLANGVTTMHNFQTPAAVAKNEAVENYEGGVNYNVIVNNQQPGKSDVVQNYNTAPNYETVQNYNTSPNYETVQNYNPAENGDIFDYAAVGSYTAVENFEMVEPAYGNSENYDSFGNITNEEKPDNSSIHSNSFPTPGISNFRGRRHGRRRNRHRRHFANGNVDCNNNERICYTNDPCTSASSRSMPYTFQQQQPEQSTMATATPPPPSVRMIPPLLRPFDIFKCPHTGKLFEVYRQMDCRKRFGIHHDFQEAMNLIGEFL